MAEFFDEGESRSVAWGRRPQAAALVALLADACRVWDAIVVGEYERAFYGSQYALMAPLFEHYGVQLWMPETGGRVDFASEHDEQAMTMLGLSSKREVTRTSIRVRTAMAVHSVARIARALNEAGVPCPSAADPQRNPHRAGTGWVGSFGVGFAAVGAAAPGGVSLVRVRPGITEPVPVRRTPAQVPALLPGLNVDVLGFSIHRPADQEITSG